MLFGIKVNYQCGIQDVSSKLSGVSFFIWCRMSWIMRSPRSVRGQVCNNWTEATNESCASREQVFLFIERETETFFFHFLLPLFIILIPPVERNFLPSDPPYYFTSLFPSLSVTVEIIHPMWFSFAYKWSSPLPESFSSSSYSASEITLCPFKEGAQPHQLQQRRQQHQAQDLFCCELNWWIIVNDHYLHRYSEADRRHYVLFLKSYLSVTAEDIRPQHAQRGLCESVKSVKLLRRRWNWKHLCWTNYGKNGGAKQLSGSDWWGVQNITQTRWNLSPKDQLISEDFLDEYLIRTLPSMEVGITTRWSSHPATERNFTDSRCFFVEATVQDLQR